MTFIRVLLSVLDTKKDRDAHMGQFTVFLSFYFVLPSRFGPAEGRLHPFPRRSSLAYSALTYSALKYKPIVPCPGPGG